MLRCRANNNRGNCKGIGVFDSSADVSDFVDHVASELSTGSSSLFGIELSPEAKFSSVTKDFTASATSAFSNSAGARRLPVPEPDHLTLLAMSLLELVLLSSLYQRHRKTKRHA